MSSRDQWTELENRTEFIGRHIGPRFADSTAMLKTLGLASLDELVKTTVQAPILSKKDLDIGEAMTEAAMLAKARTYASQNLLYKSFIGMGYYGTLTPTVVLRNVLENPGWYTAYTPYQAEIAQGRLEALLNFQT
ncbi:MAG: glycine dehydrogenase (aminomethyl-transferring), partial [Bdellovibrionota bacterium]